MDSLRSDIDSDTDADTEADGQAAGAHILPRPPPQL
jgi:hypothetical protein